jgi:hypothetical protein
MVVWWLVFTVCWGVLFVALAVDIWKNYKAPRPWYVFIVWPAFVVVGLWKYSIADTPLAGSLRLASVVPVIVLLATLGRPTLLFSGEDFERSKVARGGEIDSAEPVCAKAKVAAHWKRTKRIQWAVMGIGITIVVVVGIAWPEFFGIKS